jgi:hypothetical protein
MALPVVKSSTKVSKVGAKKFKIRAYAGKEEKALLMAKLQKDPATLIQTALDVISSCSDSDASELTTGEFEKLFLDIRSISVSDTLEPNLVCKHCEASNPVKIPVSAIKEPAKYVEELELEAGESDSGTKIFVKLKTPTIGSINKHSSEEDADMKIIFDSISSIYASDGEVYDTFEYEEFKAWFEGLTGVYLRAVLFAREAPALSYSKKFKCMQCKQDNEFELRGLESFLH